MVKPPPRFIYRSCSESLLSVSGWFLIEFPWYWVIWELGITQTTYLFKVGLSPAHILKATRSLGESQVLFKLSYTMQRFPFHAGDPQSISTLVLPGNVRYGQVTGFPVLLGLSTGLQFHCCVSMSIQWDSSHTRYHLACPYPAWLRTSY